MARSLIGVFAVALILGGLSACGDDDDSASPDGGAGSGGKDSGTKMDGSAGSSGKGGSGGSSGSGGSAGSMAMDAGDLYSCVPAEPDPGGNATEGQSCCDGLGTCTKDPTGPGSAAYGVSNCKASAGLVCAPMAGLLDGDAGVDNDGGTGSGLPTCRMTLPGSASDAPDYEGRCIPSCFVAADPSSSNLEQGSCDSGSKCVPCYSPITGESTGACEQNGDAPVDPAPDGFAECGDGAGYCVGSGLASSGGGANAMLMQLTCADGEVCAPKPKVIDRNACFAHCNSQISGPGACVAKFIIPEMYQALLPQDTCEDGEICAPCVSAVDNMPTGACM